MIGVSSITNPKNFVEIGPWNVRGLKFMNHRKKYYWIYKIYGSVSGKVKIKKSFFICYDCTKNEEILNWKLHFLCSAILQSHGHFWAIIKGTASFSHNGFHGFQIFGRYEIQIFRYTLEVKRGMLYTRHLFYINDVDLDGKTYLNYLTSVLRKTYIPIRINLIFFHAPWR